MLVPYLTICKHCMHAKKFSNDACTLQLAPHYCKIAADSKLTMLHLLIVELNRAAVACALFPEATETCSRLHKDSILKGLISLLEQDRHTRQSMCATAAGRRHSALGCTLKPSGRFAMPCKATCKASLARTLHSPGHALTLDIAAAPQSGMVCKHVTKHKTPGYRVPECAANDDGVEACV